MLSGDKQREQLELTQYTISMEAVASINLLPTVDKLTVLEVQFLLLLYIVCPHYPYIQSLPTP